MLYIFIIVYINFLKNIVYDLGVFNVKQILQNDKLVSPLSRPIGPTSFGILHPLILGYIRPTVCQSM